MISDSPYDVGAPVLTPLKGILAGLVAAFAMLLMLALLQPVSRVAPDAFLAQIGQVFMPGGEPGTALLFGVILHFLIGAVLGLLYALCQMQIAPRNLIGVGIFYGFVLWVFCSPLLGWAFGEKLRELLRSWPVLAAFLLYGFGLATMATWSLSRRPARSARAVAKD